MKKLFIAAVIIVVLAAILISYSQPKEKIIILHAGSLSIPFEDMAKEFEKKYGIVVIHQPAGSVATIKKVTELGRKADIVASADWRLIQTMMEPDYADYCIQFAANKMVIAYTEKSDYWNEINESNWYEILEKKNVRIAFSDPNKDPCGYRSIFLLQLASMYYHKDIFGELIEKQLPIKRKEENGSVEIIIPPSDQLKSNDKIMIRPMEIDLMASLETGEIDYLFIYKSVAIQHGVKYIELPPQIDLSSIQYEQNYSRVKVVLSDGRIISGKSIVYGITIPKNAPHKKAAIQFLKMLLSNEGKKIIEKDGMVAIQPRADNKNLLPPSIKPYVK